MKARLFLLVLLAPAACATYATTGEYTYAIQAAPKVNRGEDFIFRVDLKSTDGSPADGVCYRYIIDWPTLKGSPQKGESHRPVKIRVKGGTGTGLLRVYAYGPDENLVQVAQQEFKIE